MFDHVTDITHRSQYNRELIKIPVELPSHTVTGNISNFKTYREDFKTKWEVRGGRSFQKDFLRLCFPETSCADIDTETVEKHQYVARIMSI